MEGNVKKRKKRFSVEGLIGLAIKRVESSN